MSFFFFFKQKTAYEMRISDWSSDVCSSDLGSLAAAERASMRSMSDAAELPPAIPAATVVLLRDGDEGLETLMLHRTSKVAFGGMWVFPGGRLDPEDRRLAALVARAAARRSEEREAMEEFAVRVARSLARRGGKCGW